jgi:hypothetical protein
MRLLFACLICVSTALAQQAQLSGLIKDSSDSAVPEAQVSVMNAQTGGKRTTVSNSAGLYSLPSLLPGQYKITVEKEGFETSIREGVTLEVAQTARMDFTLRVGATQQAVTVQGDVQLVNTTDASVSTVVDRQFVENIPLNGRSFQSLIALTPGVVVTPTDAGSDNGQFSVAGQRAGSNYFTVDGVSANFAAAHGIFNQQSANGGLPALSALGSTSGLVSIDALQEFRIETSTYAPEYGRESGGQIMLVTRSGTNRFHGTAFDYLRNNVFDANDWFADSTGLAKPQERQNDFGGVLGGPIIKDKTFFFFSYEGLRVVQPRVAITDVPSVASRQSATGNLQAILDAFPLPNGPVTGVGLNQLAGTASNPSSLDATSIRIDHAINSKVNIFGRYNHSPSNKKEFGDGSPSNQYSGIAENIDTATVGLTAILTPAIANDLRINYSRAFGSILWAFTNAGGGVVPPESALVSPWQSLSTGWAYFQDTTGRNVQLLEGFGGSNLNRQINLTDSVAVAKGSHMLKFGVDLRRLTPVEHHPETGTEYLWLGTHYLAEGQSPDLTALIEDPGIIDQRFYNFSLYGQDTWKASHRLTLTFGVRWDYNPPPATTSGNAPYVLSEVSDLATATLLPRGTPLWHADWKNFAPRFGASYLLRQNPDHQTVLRVGFGQFYDIGTSAAAALDNGQGFFPYSLVTTLCSFGSGPGCNYATPYSGSEPPFVFTQPYQGDMRGFNPNLKLPYALQWSVALEQTLSASQTFKVSYLGSAGRRLLRDDVINSPNPILSTLFLATNEGRSNYDALQLQFQRRLSHGLQALVSYTWSHSLDLNSGDVASPWGGASVGIPSNLYNIKQEYGDSDFDIRQSLSAAVTYNVPTPQIANSLARGVLRNWSIDGISSARSGTPFNVLYQPADPGLFTTPQGGAFDLRPDQVPGQPVFISDPNAPGGKRLNAAAFEIPSVLGQGSEGRNTIRGFPLVQIDLAVRRQFNLTERINLQFRAEAFNVINHPNFGNPSNVIGTCPPGTPQGVPCTPLYGWGTSLAMLNQSLGGVNDPYGSSFGTLYQVGGPRSLQLSMKLQF